MRWYDEEQSNTLVSGGGEGGSDRRDPSSSPEESPLRVRKRRDKCYDEDVVAVDENLRVEHVLGAGDDDERRYGSGCGGGGGGGGGGERRRRRKRENGADGGGHTVVVLQLLEDALSRLQGRRPSTAHVDLLQHSAALKTRMFGPQSSATGKALRDTIVACNSLAMSALGRGNTSRCKDLLARALEIVSDARVQGVGDDSHRSVATRREDYPVGGSGGIPGLQILTLNNTACLHRRLGEPKRALRCLRRAAEIGRRSDGSEHLEATHLNACAVLSELGRHEEALEHARSAVFYGQEHEELGMHAGKGTSGVGAERTVRAVASRRARLATLAVSYYNLAVELEYTHRYEACLEWYHEAVKLARDPDVQNEELTKTFQRSYAGARKKHAPCLPRGTIAGKGGATSEPTAPTSDRRHLGREGVAVGSRSSLGNVRPRGGSPCLNADDAAASSPASFVSAGYHRHSSVAAPEATRDDRDNVGGFAVGGAVGGGHYAVSGVGVEWPCLGRMERQRAGDQRRSKNGRYTPNVDTMVGVPSVVPSPSGGTGGIRKVQQQQQHENHASHTSVGERVTFRAERASIESNKWEGEAQSRSRPSLDRSFSGVLRPRGQGRPASAEAIISTEPSCYSQRGRVYLEKVSHAVQAIPETSDMFPLDNPTPQPVGLRLGGATINRKPPEQSALEKPGTTRPGHDRRYRPPGNARRPKSAYPRLEEGSSVLVVDVGGRKNGDGVANVRLGGSRSRSACALRDSASESLWRAASTSEIECRPREGGGGESTTGQGTHRSSQSSPVEKIAGPEPIQGRRSSGSRTANSSASSSLRRSRSLSSSATGAPRTGRWENGSLEEVAQNEASSRKTGSLLHRTGPAAVVGCTPKLARKGRGSIGSSISSSTTLSHRRGLPQPPGRQTSLTSKKYDGGGVGREEMQREHAEEQAESRVDNGRDGKLYIDLGQEECWKSVPSEFVSQHSGGLQEGLRMAVEGRAAEEVKVDEKPMVSLKTGKGTSQEETATVATGDDQAIAAAVLRSQRRFEAAIVIRRAVLGTVNRGRRFEGESIERRDSSVSGECADRADRVDGRARELPGVELDNEARSGQTSIVVKAPGEVEQAVLDELQHKTTLPPSEGTSSATSHRDRRIPPRAAADRRVLAASAIRVWIARAFLVRTLRRRRIREGVNLRWEREIRRIAATRIQAAARGVARRSRCRRAARAARTARDVQRLFRGHRGRRHARKKRQILWEEVVARHGAAGVIQNFWQSRRNRAIARQLQRERRAQAAEAMRDQTSATAAQRQTSSALVPTDVLSAKPPPLSNPCTGASPTVLVAQNPTDQDQEREQERREVREGNDAFIYLLWGGFTSLITAEAARHAVRRAIATSLLALAAAALGDFNREQRNVGETTASSNTDRTSSSPSSSSYTSSSYSTLSTSSPSCSTRQSSSTSAPSGVNRAPGPVDTASLYHGTRHFEREMAVAGRRVAGVVRARGGSLSAVRSAIMRLVGDGVDSDGDGECLDDLGGWGVKAARMEAEHVVLEAVQELWGLLSPGVHCLARPDARETSERLAEMLSATLQDLVTDLGRINSLLLVQQQQQQQQQHAGTATTNTPVKNVPTRLPAALVEALSSSAASSLLAHPDFTEVIATASAGADPDGTLGSGSDEEYAPLVAEVYGLLLMAPGPWQGHDETGRLDRSAENNDHKEGNSDQTRAVDAASRATEQPPSSFLRANDRLQLLRVIGQQTEKTAEELVCILEGPGRNERTESNVQQNNGPLDQRLPSARENCCYDYFNAIRGLTDSIWNLAFAVSRPADLSAAKEVNEEDEEEDEEENEKVCGEWAARRLQGWARRQIIRTCRARAFRRNIEAAIAIQRCARRRAKQR